mgnify:CR=1 FL=1
MDNPHAFPAGWPKAGYEPHYGMTLRDWFAGQALAGIAANEAFLVKTKELGDPKTICAKAAYEFADAMLAARKETDNAHD